MNWDWWTLLPETLHQVTIIMSERGIPASYRHMHGFGSHTFSFISAANERHWVKFHFRCQQGVKNLTDATPITDFYLGDDSAGLMTNAMTLDPRTYGVAVTKRF